MNAQTHQVDFSANKWSGCAPLAVEFRNLSDPGYTQVVWSFGIGGNATNADTAGRIYTQPGEYTVTLTVTYPDGVVKKEKKITVYKKPTAAFTTSQASGCAPLPVTFTDKSVAGDGAIARITWDFGDGATGSGGTASHIYDAAGEQTAYLTVVNSYGCMSTASAQIKVSAVPEVTFTSSATESCVLPFTVSFTNGSTIPPPATLSYQWDFGDGTGSTDVNPEHIYTREGRYVVRLTATTPDGCQQTFQLPDTVVIAKMKPGFRVEGNACQGQVLTLVNTTTPAPLSVKWEFPGDSIQTGMDARFTPPLAGDYTIKMTATGNGCEESITQVVHANTLPVVDFSATPELDCHVPANISFTSQTTNATAWEWTFGDGATGTDQHPSHTYQAEGNYTVTLLATSSAGCQQSLTKQGYVRIQKPTVSFNMSAEGGCLPFEATFTPVVNSQDPVVRYSWNFGDGVTSSQEAPAHTYTTEGDFTVTLEIETQAGCKLSATRLISAGAPVQVDFDVDHTIGCQPEDFIFTNKSVPTGTKWLWIFPDDNFSTETGQQAHHEFYHPGKHDVTLEVTNRGCVTILTKEDVVEVKQPAAHFAVENINCDKPYERRFTDNSEFGRDGARYWQWDFGDNVGASAEQSPAYTYKDTGTYTVSLRVDFEGCSSIVRKTIHIIDFKPVIRPSSQSVCAGKGVTFTLDRLPAHMVRSIIWKWGDGSSRQIAQAEYNPNEIYTHVYTRPDTFQVSVSVEDINGCIHEADPATVVVNRATPRFTPVTLSPCKDQVVAFADQSYSAPNGNIVSWTWDFGDGSPRLTYTQFRDSVTHAYSKAANYSVKLTVTDNHGCTGTSSPRVIKVEKLQAEIAVAKPEACLNKPFQFNNRSTGDGLTSVWDFGDGNTSTETAPRHTYTNPGVYTVKLTVTNRNGCQNTQEAANLVTVRNPVAAFSAPSVLDACPPVLVPFTNNSTDFDRAVWTFGDGSRSTEKSPSHTYNRPGAYDVQLVAYTAGGCASQPVVQQLPIKGPDGRQSATPLTGCLPLPVTIKAESTNAVKYIWDFDDGQVVVTSTPESQHAYREPGEYHPRVLLEDERGCQVPALGNDRIVVDQVKAHFSADATQACDGGNVFFRDSSSGYAKDQLGMPLRYHWDFGIAGSADDTATGSTPQFHYPETGAYQVKLTATSQYGCTDEVTLPVVITPQPKAEILPIAPVCAGSSIKIMGREARQLPNTRWVWKVEDREYTGTDSLRVTFNGEGERNVQLTISQADGSCPDVATATARVDPQPALSPSPQNASICQGASIQLLANTTHDARVTWTNYNISDPHSHRPLARPEQDTTYHVLAENSFGCTSEADLRITVTQPHDVNVSDAAVCLGQQVQLHASGAARYQWTGGAGLNRTDVPDPIAKPSRSTTYSVIGFGRDNCFTDTAQVTVTVNPLPEVNAGPDQTVPTGTELRLQLQGSPDIVKVQWQPDTWLSCTDCMAPLAQPKSSITYHVIATNRHNCINTDDINIKMVCESGSVFLPNTFTPNGDGQNDIFYVRGRGVKTVNVFRIFNRWGQLVFERSGFNVEDASTGWDGRYNGTPLNPDVFIYYAEMVCDNNETFVLRGNVTLLR